MVKEYHLQTLTYTRNGELCAVITKDGSVGVQVVGIHDGDTARILHLRLHNLLTNIYCIKALLTPFYDIKKYILVSLAGNSLLVKCEIPKWKTKITMSV